MPGRRSGYGSDMARVLQSGTLPGSRHARRFEGREYGSNVSFFLSHNPPGTGASLHRHPYEETFIVLEGRSTFTVDGQKIDAEAGSVVVVPAGAVHGFVSSGEGWLRQVGIHPSDHVMQEDLAD